MRRIGFILQKEFIQIFRTKSMVGIIFFMPVIQLLILSNAATFEMKNIRMHVIDADQSSMSRALIRKFTATGYFQLVDYTFGFAAANRNLEMGKADIVIQIPQDFENDLIQHQQNKIQFAVNAVDGSAGVLAYGYANQIVASFNRDNREKFLPPAILDNASVININYSNWFNPDLNYKTFMVPGLVVLLVTMVGMFLAGMNIVREKEIGTIEQLNVTPIHKTEFIIGKLLPFWILAMVELTVGITVGKLVFNIPIVGNIGLIYLFASVYLMLILGLGLFISTITDTQQQAMFISWFILVVFILLSGLFTAIESMPDWAQRITLFNPVAYFIRVVRMVMLKGSHFADIQNDLLVMLGFAVLINLLAVWNYRKTTA